MGCGLLGDFFPSHHPLIQGSIYYVYKSSFEERETLISTSLQHGRSLGGAGPSCLCVVTTEIPYLETRENRI